MTNNPREVALAPVMAQLRGWSVVSVRTRRRRVIEARKHLDFVPAKYRADAEQEIAQVEAHCGIKE